MYVRKITEIEDSFAMISWFDRLIKFLVDKNINPILTPA